MAALTTSTPSITLPDLIRRLLPLPALDLFDTEDCDDSGACQHVVDRDVDACDSAVATRREVA